MPKMTGYSKKPCGNGVAPGRGAGKPAAVRGNASGQRPPSTAKGACRPAGSKGGHKKGY